MLALLNIEKLIMCICQMPIDYAYLCRGLPNQGQYWPYVAIIVVSTPLKKQHWSGSPYCLTYNYSPSTHPDCPYSDEYMRDTNNLRSGGTLPPISSIQTNAAYQSLL